MSAIILIATVLFILTVQTNLVDCHNIKSNTEQNDSNNESDNNKTTIYEGGVQSDKQQYRVEKLIVTAYAPFDNKSGICNNGDPNTTATGSKPDWGTVAVNPNRFPYGTEFYIPGYGKGIARDTGGIMQADDNIIDVYVDTYAEAINWWGKRELEVIVYGDQ